ncbi:hypothetical protein EBZ39_16845 [bacterium]|nr:hypothetical protein [bacterium]
MFRRIFALFLLVAVNQCAAADDASIVWPAAFSSSFKKAWGEYAPQTVTCYRQIRQAYRSGHIFPAPFALGVLAKLGRIEVRKPTVSADFWIPLVCQAKLLAEHVDGATSEEVIGECDVWAENLADIITPFWDRIRTVSDQHSAKLVAAALGEIAASFGFDQPQPGAVIGESDVIFPMPLARVERWQAIAQARWPSDVVDILRGMRLEKDAEELAERVDRMSLASRASKRSRRG